VSTVYIAPGVAPVINWHKNRDCHVLDTPKPVKKSELPKDAGPCAFCAGGIRADDIKEMGETQ
jgi:hypothetical protein